MTRTEQAGAEPPLLHASGIRVRRGRRKVLTGVDLQVRAGEVVALLGPNGAGKSTLLGVLGGTLHADAGTVERHGRVATSMQNSGLATRSVRSNVELALAWWGVPRSERRPRAAAALARMNADSLARRHGMQLSGGERRRVHLARAVALEPDVMLLDEPFDGLDPQTHADLRDDLTSALRDVGAGVVVVLHDRADAWAMADRVAVLLDGAIRADAPPRELLAAPPTIGVAKFLGYDGELTVEGRTVLTRAIHVRTDPAGRHTGVVARLVVTEDEARIRIDADCGSAWASDRDGRCRIGDVVRFDLGSAPAFTAEGRLCR